MKACKDCKWWGKVLSCEVLSDQTFGRCRLPEELDMPMLLSACNGKEMLFTRADFYCKGWQKKEEE